MGGRDGLSGIGWSGLCRVGWSQVGLSWGGGGRGMMVGVRLIQRFGARQVRA